MPDAFDSAALVAADLPQRIDRGFHERLRKVGLAVHDLSPLYLVKPERDLTWVETETGEIACRPGQLIAYDPRTDRLSVIDESAAAGRYSPIAVTAHDEAVPPTTAPTEPLDDADDISKAPPSSEPTPATGEGE